MWKEQFGLPSCVSKREEEEYFAWMKDVCGKSRPKVLLLGATPQIRDRLNDLGCETSLIDLNLDMVLAMNSLMRTKPAEKATVIANWLENPLQEGYFDVIIGDGVLPNVPFSERRKLLSEVNRLLKPKGIFLTRAFYMPKKSPYKSVEEILSHFEGKEPTGTNLTSLVWELQIFAYDPKNHLGTITGPKALVEKFRAKSRFSVKDAALKKILGVFWDFWCVHFIKKAWVYTYKDYEEKEYQEFFKIVKTFETDDHPYGKLTPMYWLERK